MFKRTAAAIVSSVLALAACSPEKPLREVKRVDVKEAPLLNQGEVVNNAEAAAKIQAAFTQCAFSSVQPFTKLGANLRSGYIDLPLAKTDDYTSWARIMPGDIYVGSASEDYGLEFEVEIMNIVDNGIGMDDPAHDNRSIHQTINFTSNKERTTLNGIIGFKKADGLSGPDKKLDAAIAHSSFGHVGFVYDENSARYKQIATCAFTAAQPYLSLEAGPAPILVVQREIPRPIPKAKIPG